MGNVIWGMLLSRKWDASLGGSIQMDWTYAIIPASEDAHVKLYREKERKYHVEDPDEPDNEYIYEIDSLGNHAIYANYHIPIIQKEKNEEVDVLWRMSFDGVFSKSGKGARIVLTSPSNTKFNFAYRLEFDASNNVVEYEALLLGLEIAKDMAIRVLSIRGDSDLIISQVKNLFACKCGKLKSIGMLYGTPWNILVLWTLWQFLVYKTMRLTSLQ